jgi:hypothetical protein
MSRSVANVDVITDSFEIWLLETNELLHALSTEIITANSTYANTGNTAFPRTAQLYGTFGANNLVVKDWMKGGNVNGSFANLMISTNTVLSNTTATEIRLEVANGSSNTFMWQYGLHAGLTGANLVANTTKLTIQSNATVNTTANATLVSVTNSTSSANVDAISFKTGLFTGNTISVSVSNSTGYSVFANTDTIKVGNSTVNTMIVSNSTTSFIDTDGYVRILGNTDIANTLLVVGNTSLSNTLAVTGATTLSNTLAVTGAATLSNTLSVTGAANTLSTLGVGGAANLASTLGVIGATALSNTLAITGNTTLANTLAVTGAATLSRTLALTGAATLSNTIAVTGTASYANIVTFKTEHVIDVFANGNLGATVGSDLLVFQFPKADYSSVKLLIQLKNAGNTQISEALIAHDTTDAYLTTYGTVSAPPTANAGLSLLGNFSANADTTNVRVYVNQKIASTAAKVVAQFIK